mgnify:CR=1 FL=1
MQAQSEYGYNSKIEGDVVLTTVDAALAWFRKNSVWPMPMGLACCAIELMAVGASRFDISRFGSEVMRFSPRQADCMIVAGTVTYKMAGSLKRIYDQMPEPKWVIAMGACASTGGMYRSYAVLQGVDQILPVDVYGDSELATSWNVAMGVKVAVENGATILNMSLGTTADSPIIDSIIQQAIAHGVIVFAAAGNEPVATPNYPAAIPGVNAITALGAPGQLAAYANYGNFVQMALPGASLVVLGNQAYIVQGTSPASAYAAGVAAGYKTINCDTWLQIQAMMRQRFPVPQK